MCCWYLSFFYIPFHVLYFKGIGNPKPRKKRTTDYIIDFSGKGDCKEATPNEFPWVVALKGGCNREPEDTLCAGSLISPSLVISAKHCLLFCKPMKRAWAALGIHTTTGPPANTPVDAEQEIDVIDYHQPPIDKPNVGKRNDLAIYVLERPARLTTKVCPILIPLKTDEFEKNSDFVIAGWGKTSPKLINDLSKNLRKCAVGLRFNLNKDFKDSRDRFYMYGNNQTPDDKGCSPCNGDSGINYEFKK